MQVDGALRCRYCETPIVPDWIKVRTVVFEYHNASKIKTVITPQEYLPQGNQSKRLVGKRLKRHRRKRREPNSSGTLAGSPGLVTLRLPVVVVSPLFGKRAA